jgi:hypothetical protein
MKKYVLRSLISLIAVAFISIGVAFAHGAPVIAVQPMIAAAGGQITVTGTGMGAGETFTLTLERATTSTYLGTVTAAANKDHSGMTAPVAESNATPESSAATSDVPVEGGFFTATYIIPDKTPPGSYTVKATAEDGDATETDLTITEPSGQASADPAMIQEPTGELHQLDRSKPTGEVAAILVVAMVSGGLGLWLARRH